MTERDMKLEVLRRCRRAQIQVMHYLDRPSRIGRRLRRLMNGHGMLVAQLLWVLVHDNEDRALPDRLLSDITGTDAATTRKLLTRLRRDAGKHISPNAGKCVGCGQEIIGDGRTYARIRRATGGVLLCWVCRRTRIKEEQHGEVSDA